LVGEQLSGFLEDRAPVVSAGMADSLISSPVWLFTLMGRDTYRAIDDPKWSEEDRN
jgi:hypothetical protein